MKPTPSQTIHTQWQPPGLYIVATPIGNLQDITLRALELLKNADLIACEDTRVTGKLLAAYGIRAKLVSCHDHNEAARAGDIFSAIREGKKVALVSDAGTPLISDPGYKLVRAAVAEGLYVTALPGASSAVMGAVPFGFAQRPIFLRGFFACKKEALKKDIAALATIPATLVLFESAKRLTQTLAVLSVGLGNREAAVMRELTKLYEEARRGTLGELSAHYEKAGEPKGEVVIVIAPPQETAASDEDIAVSLKALLKKHGVKEAASLLSQQTGRPRKEIYALALKHRHDR